MGRSRSKTRHRPRSHPRGILQVMSGGYGFVQTAEGEFFVPASKMGGAFDGDEVELAQSKGYSARDHSGKKKNQRNKPTARIVKVIVRAHDTLVGRYEYAEPFGIVVPDDPKITHDIFTRHADAPHVVEGDIVRVRITAYPTSREAASGVIEEVLGHEGDRGLAIDVLIARFNIETSFSSASLQQAEHAQVDADQALSAGYRDLRERLVFTIDPEDARDYDDALSLEKVDGMWRLGVHIADVSHYVDWGSSIDLDARRRATSVYLVDRAIPMLPENLSSEICSLKPEETRRVMTVDLFLNDLSEVTRYEIYPSLVRSNKRFTYAEVQDLLDTGNAGVTADAQSEQLFERMVSLRDIALILEKKRQKKGGIEFLTKEAKVVLNEEGTPLRVEIRKRSDATQMVEEAMVLANLTVAKHLLEEEAPCIYRVHEAPSPESLAALVPILQEFKYLDAISTAQLIAGDPFTIQEILEASKGRPEAELLSSLLLRSMKRAVYSPHNIGHYGLAAQEYVHFTSPIRRYPDLVIHRMLKAQSLKRPETFEDQVNSLTWLAEHSSKMERIAEACGCQSQEIKLAELMQHEVGNVFDAVISGVMSYGVFVTLENTAEGLVPVRTIGDEYFVYDDVRQTLTGQDSEKELRLGQKMRVILDAVDISRGRLNFHISRT